MRTTNDLVEELQAEALAYKLDSIDTLMGVQLVVGFEEYSEFVESSDADALAKLNDMIRRGGIPIGYITFIKRPNGLDLKVKGLTEHAGDEGAAKFLTQLAEHIAAAAKQVTASRKTPPNS